MKHASEKSKRESWRRGTRCDGEGQVKFLIRGIKQAMKSHIIISGDIYWINENKVTWIRSGVLIIWGESPLSLAQGEFAQVKIMLIPSSLDKDENDTKKNQVDKHMFILLCFISLLSIGHRTIKRDAAWWSWQNQSVQNPERFHEWWKKTKIPKCEEISPTDQTGFAYRSNRLDLF